MVDVMGSWPILLAQVAEFEFNEPTGGKALMLLLPILVIGALLIGVTAAMAIRAGSRKKEMEHEERMRAIELGRPLPGEACWWTPSRMAAGIGVGVPIGVFALGLSAAETIGSAPFIWPSAGAVGVAAVICGTVLAARIASNPQMAPDPTRKPYVHPDIYDAAEYQHS